MNESAGLRVLIVDDEAPARSRMRDLLHDCQPHLPLALAGEAANGVEAIAQVNRAPVDVVLLDIRMPVMDGIETARHLQKLTPPPGIIFTTALEGHAVAAFELNALDYLLKPIRAERLLAALRKAMARRPLGDARLAGVSPRARSHLSISDRGRVTLVPVAEVCYMRAELKYVTLRTRDGEHLLEESLTSLEQEFADRFVRIHRNCLVARDAIAAFEKQLVDGGEARWMVVLKDLPERLPVSRRQAHVVRSF